MNGQSVFDVDCVIKNSPLLPSYAIPLFIRIDDHIMSDSESHNSEDKSSAHDDNISDHNSHNKNINENKTNEDTNTHMTTTFKYRKFVLIK